MGAQSYQMRGFCFNFICAGDALGGGQDPLGAKAAQ
jgi:hypothetical protein